MNREITQEEWVQALNSHRIWASTYGKEEAQNGIRLTLQGSKLKGVIVQNADLSSCELVNCEIFDTVFRECDYTQADIIESVFSNCLFEGCTFRKANLRGSDFRASKFLNCDFSRAELTDAHLLRAHIIDCSLDWAWLIRTDLRYATMQGSSFAHARLLDTKIYNDSRQSLGSVEGAIVKDADFSPQADGSVKMGAEVLNLLTTNT